MLDIGLNKVTVPSAGMKMSRRGYPCEQAISFQLAAGNADIVLYDLFNGNEVTRISAAAPGDRIKVDFPKSFRVDVENPAGLDADGVTVLWDA